MIIDQSEEDQLEAAIQMSLRESGKTSDQPSSASSSVDVVDLANDSQSSISQPKKRQKSSEITPTRRSFYQ